MGMRFLKEGYIPMKKLLTLLATFAVAVSLAMPVYAKKGEKGEKGGKKETASTTQHGKAHEKHAKKKGATKGEKEGQEETNPGQTREATPKQ